MAQKYVDSFGTRKVLTVEGQNYDIFRLDLLEKAGFKAELAEVTFKPTVENAMKGEDAARMQKLIDNLEAIDDVQEVHTTAVMEA